MLLLRPSGQRADGPRRTPIVRTRARKFGPILDETCISVRRDLLISGANASGKTRWLSKLASKAPEIWKQRPMLFLRAVEPLHAWYADARIARWADEQAKLSNGQPWARLQSHQRIDVLVAWCEAHKPVLIVDDLQLLARRKMDVVRRLVLTAGIVVAGTFAEQRIPITLRMAIEARNPQKVFLKSEAAYDSTSLVLWLVILISMGAGAWQLAAIVGGMKVLAGGRRAASQQ